MGSKTDIYVACAGAAKTTTLINKVVEEVKNGCDPSRIAFVTYTKVAALEARERAAKALGIKPSALKRFQTIHSMVFHALNLDMSKTLDQQRMLEFGKEYSYRIRVRGKDRTEGIDCDTLADWDLPIMEQLRRNNPQMYDRTMDDIVDNSRLIAYIQDLTKFKRDNGYIDFTDMLEEYLKKQMVEDVDVACLDEMQDSTPLQWQVVLQAFRNCRQVYAAGDPRQTLYTYAGSEPSTLLKMRGDVHPLDLSYRVPSTIMKLANSIITNIDSFRVNPGKSNNEGGKVEYLSQIQAMPALDISKSYYFLARTGSQLKAFQTWCLDRGYNYLSMGPYGFMPAVSEQDIFNAKFGFDTSADKDVVERIMATPQPKKITISTIHGVKGGEADVVVLSSDMSYLTHRGFQRNEDPEHMVYYVGVTRARETLYILEPQTKYGYPYLL